MTTETPAIRSDALTAGTATGATAHRRVLRNFGMVSIGELAAGVLSFVSFSLLARALGSVELGWLGFANAALTYFAVVTRAGADPVGTRLIATGAASPAAAAGTFLRIRGAAAFLCAAALAALAVLAPIAPGQRLVLLLAGLTLVPMAVQLDWAFAGVQAMTWPALMQIARELLFLGTVLLLSRRAPHASWVVLAQAAVALVTGVGLLACFVRRHGIGGPGVAVGSVVRDAWPVALAALLTLVFFNSNVLFLAFLRPGEEVGWYTAGSRVMNVLVLLLGAFFNALFPFSVRLYARSASAFQTHCARVVEAMATLGWPVAVGGVIVMPRLVALAFGAAFEPAVAPTRILMGALLAIFLNITYSRGLLSANRMRAYLLGVGVPAAANLAFNAALVPHYGMLGAAWATVLAEAAGFLVIYVAFRRVARVPLWPATWRPALAAGAMAAALLPLGERPLTVLIPVGALVYGVVLWAIGGVRGAQLAQLLGDSA